MCSIDYAKQCCCCSGQNANCTCTVLLCQAVLLLLRPERHLQMIYSIIALIAASCLSSVLSFEVRACVPRQFKFKCKFKFKSRIDQIPQAWRAKLETHLTKQSLSVGFSQKLCAATPRRIIPAKIAYSKLIPTRRGYCKILPFFLKC